MRIPIHIEIKIAWFMSIVKVLIGFSIIGTGGGINSVVLVLGGTLLMITGFDYIVPRVFDKVELYLMNKRHPDCNVIKYDGIRGKDE